MTKQLVIDRSIWLHGEGEKGLAGGAGSSLFRPADQKMCCLGIYLHTVCGMPKEVLKHVPLPAALDENEITRPEESNWTDKPLQPLIPYDDAQIDTVAESLAELNDSDTIDEDYREKEVARLFKKYGDIDVTFIGVNPPKEET